MKQKEVTQKQITDAELYNNMRKIRIANIWAVRIFFIVLFVAAVISFIIPLRPQFSQVENRKLTEFPKFTFSTLFSGEYFVGIDNWYSDTFPAREFFTKLNTDFSTLFGKSDVIVHGNVEKGDKIPEQNGNNEQETPPAQEEKPQQPQELPTETIGALLINGDTAYEYYSFIQDRADMYSAAITRAGYLMNGKAAVYDIVVPTSMEITIPKKVLASVNTSDQRAAINYIYSGIIGPARKVDVYKTLKKHKDEYIYFRTDHHWTSLGAYYAYQEFMKAKGAEPTTLSDYIRHEFTPFLGSFYNSSGKHPNLAANPDTVIAYESPITNSISILSDGGWFSQKVISDMTGTPAGNVYSTFIRGDNPLSVITNPHLTDNSACIVVKESYGNAFVPFLIAHYQNVYVIDYRYISKVDPRGLVGFQADTGASDIIFINNISATRSKSLVGAVDYFVR